MSANDPSAPPPVRRYTGLEIVMIVVGVILLLPGVCSLFFMIGMISEIKTSDPIVQMAIGVWTVCFGISAIGIALIYVARKDARKSAGGNP